MRVTRLIAATLLVVLPAAAVYGGGRLLLSEPTSASGRTPPVVQAEPGPGQTVETDVSPSPASPPVLPPAPAVPVVVQAPKVPVWEKAPALEAAVAKAMDGFSGRYSVVVHDLKSGQRWMRGEQDRFHPASTIKMPVTLYAVELHRLGKLGWGDAIQYTQADFESPGGGAFETSPFGGWYPVENLVGRALRYSNNVAVNMLGRHLGWESIRAFTRSIDGELYREPDGSPSVTALSELGWWLYLEKLSREDPVFAEKMLQPLREVAYDGRIAAGLPDGVKYLHKFGSYAGYYHDGGWVMGEKPYLLVVMTAGGTEEEADTAIASVSAEVYKVMSK